MSNLTENKINMVFAAGDLAIIMNSINTVVNKLPSGSLTDEQRNSLKGIDVSNKIFVEDVLNELAISAAGIVPPYINATSIQNDLTLFEQLESAEVGMKNALQRLSDLKRIAGDEAYGMALAAYRSYDNANQQGIPGAKQSYDNLKTRFDAQNTGAGRPNAENNI